MFDLSVPVGPINTTDLTRMLFVRPLDFIDFCQFLLFDADSTSFLLSSRQIQSDGEYLVLILPYLMRARAAAPARLLTDHMLYLRR
jgi:hypothetical protein